MENQDCFEQPSESSPEIRDLLNDLSELEQQMSEFNERLSDMVSTMANRAMSRIARNN